MLDERLTGRLVMSLVLNWLVRVRIIFMSGKGFKKMYTGKCIKAEMHIYMKMSYQVMRKFL